MGFWGKPWGFVWGSGEVTSDVASLRAMDRIQCAYILVIEGCKYMFATDHCFGTSAGATDALLGSGAGSWIGRYETENGHAHAREVKPGLIIPREINQGDMDVNTGMLRNTVATFELIDFDGTLASLFATEGKDKYALNSRIAPGTSVQTTVVTKENPFSFDTADSEWVDAGGIHLDTEMLGPNGERRWLPCRPPENNTWVGLEHAAHNGQDDQTTPPRVLVSFDPVIFEGRWVALYQIIRDSRVDTDNALAWPTWDAQDSAGQCIWWGRLRDRGEIAGNRKWRLQAAGMESPLNRTLGSKLHRGWLPVSSSTLQLGETERAIAVELGSVNWNSGVAKSVYASADLSNSLSASGTAADYEGEIDTLVQSCATGATEDYSSSGGHFEDFNDNEIQVSLDRIRIRTDDGTDDTRLSYCTITMHVKVWRALGYDPALQGAHKWPLDKYGISFTRHEAGDVYSYAAKNEGAEATCPADDYWTAWFGTPAFPWTPIGDGGEESVDNPPGHNDGIWRDYFPLYEGGSVVHFGMDSQADFTIGPDAVYIPPDPLVPWLSTSQVNSTDCDSARYFAFRGKRLVADVAAGGLFDPDTGDPLEDAEHEEIYQVGRVAWVEAGSYGSITEIDGEKTLILERWMDPRAFGFDFDAIGPGEEWVALNGGEFQIECTPLNAYAYWYSGNAELAWKLLPMLLLSTGTASLSGNADTGVTWSEGDNPSDWSANNAWSQASDRAAADMGLGIPNEMVADPKDFRDAFAEGPAKEGAAADEVRYVYRTFESKAMIQSLLRPRGLAMSLAGKKYGVQKFDLFDPADADADIGDDDLIGSTSDPGSGRPDQDMRATGSINEIVLRYRWDPVDEQTAREIKERARDANAHQRGNFPPLQLEEHGLHMNGKGTDAFRLYWAFDRARFYARRHFLVRNLRIRRVKGQDLNVGSRIRLSSEWILGLDGTYGITNAIGVITAQRFMPGEQGGVYVCDALIYAGQFGDNLRVFSPLGLITDISSDVVTLASDANHLDHGEGSDAGPFAKSSWMSGGAATVGILYWERDGWALHGATQTVSSVDTGANTVTLAGAFSTEPNPNAVRMLVFVDYDDQAASSYPRTHGLPITLSGGQFGASSTDGWKYNDKD